MQSHRRTALLMSTLALLAAALLTVGPAGASSNRASSAMPRLVGIRAAQYHGYDRVVFEFSGTAPAQRTVRYVAHLIADARGTAIPVAGRAILRVSFRAASAHTDGGRSTAPAQAGFALTNVMTVVRSGDFEGVVSYGIGLAQRAAFRVSTLTRPSRVAVDIATTFRTVPMRVYFFDARRFAANTQPFVTAAIRRIPSRAPATGLLDRLFAGPTTAEQATGLRFLASRATGFSGLSIGAGIARVRLTGACSSGGSTATIAEEVATTLRQLPGVSWVKIYDPAGHTERPYGGSDSIPTCLEP